ncbi:CDP-glucose 4,6-dehydratase [Synergistales bacterium]|nr:CDP-glucose 4,6-dehydratase [Synergistales bacterium]
MSAPVSESDFWRGKKVFITGHTGFKGSWLALLLRYLGAEVSGFSLSLPSDPCMFSLLDLGGCLAADLRGDIRNPEHLNDAIAEAKPDIVFHLAAQTLVRRAYKNPSETFSTNVLGTLNVLEASRAAQSVRVIINVTTDKCYENKEQIWGYRENDPLGGDDPYSASKGCAEILSASWRKSFCPLDLIAEHGLSMATVRAGNVIGGGDWADDRIIPDCVRAFGSGKPLVLRNPGAVRPWQHVLEPLRGYVMLAEHLWDNPLSFSGAWNFGPDTTGHWPVLRVAEAVRDAFGCGEIVTDKGDNPRESSFLYLDSSKALSRLEWRSRLTTKDVIDRTVSWYKAQASEPDGILAFTKEQIEEYITSI